MHSFCKFFHRILLKYLFYKYILYILYMQKKKILSTHAKSIFYFKYYNCENICSKLLIIIITYYLLW